MPSLDLSGRRGLLEGSGLCNYLLVAEGRGEMRCLGFVVLLVRMWRVSRSRFAVSVQELVTLLTVSIVGDALVCRMVVRV